MTIFIFQIYLRVDPAIKRHLYILLSSMVLLNRLNSLKYKNFFCCPKAPSFFTGQTGYPTVDLIQVQHCSRSRSWPVPAMLRWNHNTSHLCQFP
jgi:hypothetical protein